MLKKIIKNIFRSSGYVVKKLPVDNLEENLIELFRVLEINCVIDVGAHYGEYGQLLRGIGYKNRIVSFEPVKESYEILHKIDGTDNNWILYNVALGRVTLPPKNVFFN